LAKPAESKPQELDVRQEIEHYLHLVETQARKQNVRIESQIENDLPKLFCDPAEFRQVLLNIVMNAMEAMPEGGPILLRASQLSSSDSAVGSEKKGILIEVRDSGVGIPSDLSEKVLEPFFTTKPGGTGLGLTISSNIVRRYGGEIWIGECVDGGAAVKVTLPTA